MANYVNLGPGDTAPWFHQRSASNPRYSFDTAGGRYIVMAFLGSAQDEHSKAAIATVRWRQNFFNDEKGAFFGVVVDPSDELEKRVQEFYPGYRYFYDFDGVISKAYGAMAQDTQPNTDVQYRRMWVILDPTMRIINIIPFTKDRSDLKALLTYIDGLPPPERFAGIDLMAPVLFLPNVFEPAFCKDLIDLYEKNGGEESGFMREVDGKTVMLTDHRHKRRKDYNIEDSKIRNAAQARIHRRILPQILKVHQYKVTRMERHIVCCYAAEDEAHFAAHRDNTTAGTAHRRFAVSINLNSDFEGGELSFPEYGPRSFKPPAGAAVVFSCSLLHAVSKVTRGRRYAFLPFLYDDEAAAIREANNKNLGENVDQYSNKRAS